MLQTNRTPFVAVNGGTETEPNDLTGRLRGVVRLTDADGQLVYAGAGLQ